MSRFSFLLFLFLLFLITACGPCENCQDLAAKEVALSEREQALEAREQALSERETSLEQAVENLSSDLTEEEEVELPAEAFVETEDHPIRLGTHNLTLQWISWDEPGTAEVSFINRDRYKIVGEQRSTENDDYLLIDGSLVPQDDRTFLFEGRIEYLVSHNNNGEACIKTGPLHFRASGQRQYWRLQEKTNCEGGMLTDYIDIYF